MGHDFPYQLEVDNLPGTDNKWADALCRNEDLIIGFFPPAQRIEIFV